MTMRRVKDSSLNNAANRSHQNAVTKSSMGQAEQSILHVWGLTELKHKKGLW